MAVRLVNAPIGLFEIDGVLVLKTEYCTKHEDGTVTADCYIVDSGEYFWGGVESAEERNNLMVTPVDMPTLTPPNEWVSVEDAAPDPGERVLATDGVFVGEGYINCYGKWCRPNGMKWNMFNEEVTHWMALPKSPKEDE